MQARRPQTRRSLKERCEEASPDDGRHKVGAIVGGVVEYGSDPLNIVVGWKIMNRGEEKRENMENATSGVAQKVGRSGERVSGGGGSLGGGKIWSKLWRLSM